MTNSGHVAALRARSDWAKQARPEQLFPDTTDWDLSMFLGGRGTGKTRSAAEDMWWYLYSHPGRIGHVIAPTFDSDLIGVCFEGESGLRSVVPPEVLAHGSWDRAFKKSGQPTIDFANGSVIKGFSAERPGRLRGPQCHRLWMDEFALYEEVRAGNAQVVMDLAMLGCRLGDSAQAIITTTPRPIEAVKSLIKDKRCRVRTGTTYDNLGNLSQNFINEVLKHEGTKFGRQEIYAEVLDLEEGGVIARKDIRLWPHDKPLPKLSFVIMSLDTAFTEESYNRRTHDPDYTACSVWGVFHVERNRTMGGQKLFEAEGHVILLDCWQEFLGFPELVKVVAKEHKMRYGQADKPLLAPLVGPAVGDHEGKAVDLLVIEDKGSGISLRQQLATQNIIVHAYNPGKASKIARLHMVSHAFSAGRVWIVESERHTGQPKTWAEPLVSQLCSYRGKNSIEHDDLMDTVTQALRVIVDKRLIEILPPKSLRRREPEDHETRRPEPEMANPYG